MNRNSAPHLHAWEQLAEMMGTHSLGNPSRMFTQDYHADTGQEPILDMEEAYKLYLDSTICKETTLTPTLNDLAITITPRGQEAQAKLNKLRSTHPELFL